MHKPNITLVWLLFATLLGIVPLGWADPITFSLVQASQTGTPGSTLLWQYNVTNNSGGTILGLDVSADLFTGGTPDASVFDFFGSGIANGTSLAGNLFAFHSDPNVASFNQGFFDILVLLGDGTTTDLTANYSATISPTQAVPEPSTLLLVLAAAPLLLIRSVRVRLRVFR